MAGTFRVSVKDAAGHPLENIPSRAVCKNSAGVIIYDDTKTTDSTGVAQHLNVPQGSDNKDTVGPDQAGHESTKNIQYDSGGNPKPMSHII